jgi:predicted secreted protein
LTWWLSLFICLPLSINIQTDKLPVFMVGQITTEIIFETTCFCHLSLSLVLNVLFRCQLQPSYRLSISV